MNPLAVILIVLELGFFVPIANLKGKENRCSSYTKGIIFNVSQQRKRRFLRKQMYYIPTVSYEIDGRHYETSCGRSSSAEEFRVGDAFWIMYNPADPTDVFQEDSFASLKANMTAGIGVWVILITLICLML